VMHAVAVTLPDASSKRQRYSAWRTPSLKPSAYRSAAED
jgi:hypothetical protein